MQVFGVDLFCVSINIVLRLVENKPNMKPKYTTKVNVYGLG